MNLSPARLRVRTMLLPLLLVLGAFAQAPQMYRWKDGKGRQHVTNTPPPPGAVALDIPPVQPPPKPAPPPAEAAAPATAPAPPAPAVTAEAPEWRGFGQRLEAARATRNADAAAREADQLLDEALWGGSLKALPALPVAMFVLVILLGWWIGSGLKRGTASLVMTASILAGLLLAQFTLTRFLYRSQGARLQARFAELEAHLGPGRSFRPENRNRLRLALAALQVHASPRALPWAFPREVQALRDLLPQALLDP
jgi:hypothetical protein